MGARAVRARSNRVWMRECLLIVGSGAQRELGHAVLGQMWARTQRSAADPLVDVAVGATPLAQQRRRERARQRACAFPVRVQSAEASTVAVVSHHSAGANAPPSTSRRHTRAAADARASHVISWRHGVSRFFCTDVDGEVESHEKKRQPIRLVRAELVRAER